MATLVLGSIGTALGGPLGGAIGSLIGQTIDQRVFGPGTRRGPRLEDLKVQTSSYGTAIPRIYGTMRVAGSVIWATDLVESSVQTGAKGQPDTTVYSYSVSMAVALSSRPISAIKRIWADGKLLRGAAGDFKVETGFRVLDGSDDQPIDPLIASIEGIAETPAYRGLALAVFENLQLAEYGNRIPFLTFEVEADPAPVAVGALLGDASAGAIRSDAGTVIGGYAAHGSSIRGAIEPLVDQFGLALFDDGQSVRSAVPSVIALSEEALGQSSDGRAAPAMVRALGSSAAIPTSLTLAYYEPARDYQLGQMRAAAGEGAGPAVELNLPVAMDSGAAKALAQSRLARYWAERDTLQLRLPVAHLGCEPGSLVEIADNPMRWRVERCAVEGLVPIVDLRATGSAAAALPAEPGRVSPSPDVIAGETHLALFDLPAVDGSAATGPVLLLAAATTGTAQTRLPLELDVAGGVSAITPTARPTTLGMATTVLGPGQAVLLDEVGSVDVAMIGDGVWLESCDVDALAAGQNLAVLGKEILQFGKADSIGPRAFRLSRLLRGRFGTEWAMDSHGAGEDFALLQAGTLRAIPLPAGTQGAVATVRTIDGSRIASALVSGEAVKPPAPVNLTAAQAPSGSVEASWVRRSRTGWAWLDEMDTPLGEMRELYRVRLSRGAAVIEREVSEPMIVLNATDVAALGSGAATLEVRQIGDLGVSRPAQIAITLA